MLFIEVTKRSKVSYFFVKFHQASSSPTSSSKSFVCFFASSNRCLLITKESRASIIKKVVKIYTSVKKIVVGSPRNIKLLKVIRAPKRTIAHDAPSKKLIILSNLS